MADLFASGRIVDAILLLVLIEALVLMRWVRSGRRSLLCNLTSGAALMLALRAALTGAHWTFLAACLAISGLAHGTEMVLRLGRPSCSTSPRCPAPTPAGEMP